MEDVAGGARRRRMLPLLPPALLYAAITLQSGYAIPVIPVVLRWQDKLLHAGAYGLLALLLARGLTEGLGWTPPRGLFLLAVGVVVGALGGLDEVHQVFVPGRHPDVLDGLADLVGALGGATAWVLIRGRGNRPWPS